jgi:hypothetical protein
MKTPPGFRQPADAFRSARFFRRLDVLPLVLLLALLTAFSLPAAPLYTLANPGMVPQPGRQHGYSVAVAGGLTVVGAPAYDEYTATNSGVVKIYATDTGALLYTLHKPDEVALSLFGFSVAVQGSRVVVGAPGSPVASVAGVGRVFVYDLAGPDPITPTVILDEPGAAANDQFGFSVAFSGNRVVVGAPYSDVSASNAGRAYVFDLSSGTPSTPALTLSNPDPAVDDQFGNAVAVSGDRVVVGAYGDDTGAGNAGTVYAYDLGGETPAMPTLTLHDPSPAGDDQFGISVAVSGNRLVVGVYGDDTGGLDAGAAYVYDLSGGTPTTPTVTLFNPTPSTSDQFGHAVAIEGSQVLVGTHQDDTAATDAGTAYLFDVASPTPATVVKTLTSPQPISGEGFGWAVAVSGTHLVVGAPATNAGATASGRAYAYTSTDTSVTTFDSPDPFANDHFGRALALDGNRYVVGAPDSDASATLTDSGGIYLYDLGSATPDRPVLTILNPSPATNDQFGAAVALSGSLVVVGVPLKDTTATDAGRVYVYDAASGTPAVPVAILDNPNPGANDQFGAAVAIRGQRVVVGVPNQSAGVTNAGSVYVYDLGGATPTVPVFTLAKPSPAAGDQFGVAVAIDGGRVVVGVPSDDLGVTNAGSVYIYDLAGATPTVPAQILNNPSPALNDQFGNAVAISGTRVVVGVSGKDAGGTDSGRAYAFDLAGTTPATPIVILDNPSPRVGDQFGGSVAIDGSRVVVGAQYDDSSKIDVGVAHLFNLDSPSPQLPVARLDNPTPGAGDRFGYPVAISGTNVLVGTAFEGLWLPSVGTAYVFALPFEDSTAPMGGTFTVSPASPVKAGTVLTATFAGWTDTNSFSYAVREGSNSISSGFTSATRNFTRAAGTHLVYGRITDALGRFTDTAPVQIVVDGTAPVITAPTGVLVYPSNSEGGAIVNFTVSATDNLDPSPLVTVTPSNGSVFPIGLTWVNVTAQDQVGNVATTGFSVRVWDTNAPLTAVQPEVLWRSIEGVAATERQGYSVALNGARLAVGAPNNDTGATDAGAAYVYDLHSPTPAIPVWALTNPVPAVNSYFGWAVALSGSRMVVTASADNTGAANTGSAYVYELGGATPTVPVFTLRNPTPVAEDRFGTALAISGNLVVIGTPYNDVGATDAGCAYVYDLGSPDPTVPVATLRKPVPAAADHFGLAVAIHGTRVVVSAPSDDTGATDAGSVYVYDLGSATPAEPLLTIPNPEPATNDQFGNALAIEGTRVVVGAALNNFGANDAGAAYVYDLGSPSPAVPVTTLRNPDPVASDQFGFALALSGNRVLVGVNGSDAGASAAGCAYGYDLGTTTPASPVARQLNPTPALGDQFGFAVALSGTTAVVGALNNDGSPTDIGGVYIFGPMPGSPLLAVDDLVTRPEGRPLKIPLATLLANDVSVPWSPLSVTGVDGTSAGGGTVQLLDGMVLYTPDGAFNATDSFTYTVSNGTNVTTAVVTVVVETTPETIPPNIVDSAALGETMQVTAAGISGRSYRLQHTTSLTSPVSWTDLGGAQAAPATGQMVFTDPSPTSPGFYRVITATP